VSCDGNNALQSAAAHLAIDLHVPAFIGCATSTSSKDTLDLATSLFVPNDILTVAPSALTPMLKNVPHSASQPRLVWRTTYDNAEAAAAIAAVVARINAQHGRPMRVALTRRKDANHAAFAEAFFEKLQFNGRTALANGDSYREFSFDTISSTEDRRDTAKAIAAFEPDVVVVSGDSAIIPEIEAVARATTRRPTYLLPYIIDEDALRFIGASFERRRRVYGLTTVSTTRANARLVLHYNETFPEPITRTWAPNSSYDAFYLIAYAVYAARSKAIDGPTLAASIARLVPPGLPIEVGAASILGAFDALNRGERIDVNGTTGSMDFDLRTGESRIDLAILCASVDAKGVAAGVIESGLVFDANTGELVNELRCP
jgi:branched-chain amino acid transport system substrate-binding protein